jgi:hypothetical protein
MLVRRLQLQLKIQKHAIAKLFADVEQSIMAKDAFLNRVSSLVRCQTVEETNCSNSHLMLT